MQLTKIFKRRLVALGYDPSGYAWKSFRTGMACTVLENQGVLQGGKGGAIYADTHIAYVEIAGRWTNSE